MRGKTIHIHHSPNSSYLIFSLILVMGIVSGQWEVITITTLGLVVYSLLDLIEIRDKPTPPSDENSYKRIGKIGDLSLFASKKASADYRWITERDDLIH